MRKRWNNFFRASFISLIASTLSSCNHDFGDMLQTPQEVGFYAGGAETRTEMLQNGLSAVWSAGDELAVWAKNSSGEFTLENQVFKTYGIDGKRGFFTSTLAGAMPEGTYTYYCTYPVPESVNGTEVTFNLPAVQDGKVTGGADIMIATPVQHGALTPVPAPEDGTGMRMTMNRMMHQFRFYVPEDDQMLGGEKIERILLEFPVPVAGDVVVDFSKPEISAKLSGNGHTEIDLNLVQHIGASSEDSYACLSIVPTDFEADQSLKITRAYTDDKILLFDPINLNGKNCLPGHSTPVKLKVKEIVDYPYHLDFTVTENNLGEGVNTIRFVAPEGCDWKGNGSNEFEYTPGSKINKGDVISFYFDYSQEGLYRDFSGKEITVFYDSDHAIVSEKVNIDDLTGSDAAGVSLTVPYLFYEDFAGLKAYDGDYKAGPYTSVEGASTAARDLTEYGLAGWTGARTGCDAQGTAILVGGRVDCVILGATRAYGRLDSPAMTCLKKEANLKVTFNYSGSRSGSSTYYPVGIFTSTTDIGPLNGYATQFNNDQVWVPANYVQIPNIPTNGSAAATNLQMTGELKNCDSQTRLSWHVAGMGYKNWKIDNGNQWMYIDNVKVQIAN